MLISYLSKFAPRKNKTVAVINNVVLLTHWQISRVFDDIFSALRFRVVFGLSSMCLTKPSIVLHKILSLIH